MTGIFQLVASARKEAKKMNHNSIGPEHVLLTLLQEDAETTSKLLEHLGVSSDCLRSAIEYTFGRGVKPSSGEPELARSAKRVIQLAIDEAVRLGDDYVATEHLLLGLIRYEEEEAAEDMKFFERMGESWKRRALTRNYGIFHSFGVTYEQARTEIMKLLSIPPRGSSRINKKMDCSGNNRIARSIIKFISLLTNRWAGLLALLIC